MSLSVNTLIANLLGPLHSDSLANLVWWTDGELTRFFDEAVKNHARKAGVFVARDTSSITLVQGTALYSLPARHVSTLHVAIDGVALIASSTNELELLDENYQATQADDDHPILYWYEDKSGQNKIGVYPVPAAADAGNTLEVIYHQYPTTLDEAHSNTTITVPTPIGDYLECVVLGEAYGKESDGRMPETSAAMKQLAALYEEVILDYYGEAQ